MRSFPNRPLWTIVVFALACLLLFGCVEDNGSDDDDDDDEDDDDDTGDDDDLDRCLDNGREWLRIGDGDRARIEFLCALDIDPGNEEGLYGLVLADVLHMTDVVSILVDYVTTVVDLIFPPEGGGDVKFDENDIVDRLLEIIIEGLVLDIGQEMVDTSRTLQGYEDPMYLHEGIPLVIDFELVDTMTGEFDLSFLSASESYGSLLSGASGHLLVLSLDMDISLVFLVGDVNFDDIIPAIGDIVDILILLLNDPSHPDFLVMDGDGLALFMTLGPMLGDGFDEFLEVWARVDLETDDQTDDVIGYVDLNANGVRDADEPYFLPYFEALSADEMQALLVIEDLAVELRQAFWDRTAKDLDPANPNPLHLAAFNPLLELYGLPPLFPEDMTVPIGDIYAEPDPFAVRHALEDLVGVLDLLFPGTGQFEL